MNRFLKTTAILSTIALVSAGAYSLNRESYRKGQASIKPQVETNQSELELKLSQTQIDLASKIEENSQLRQQVTTLQAEKEDLISSGEASQDEIDDLNSQIDVLNDTIANNESSINTLNVKVTKMNSIVAKTITEVEAEDLEDFTEVSSYMFAGCTQLTDVTIPDNITNIGSNAFEGCTSLTDITMQSITPPTLANTNAIPSGVNINIPDNSREAYQSATNWSDLSSQLVGDEEDVNNPELAVYEGFTFDGETLKAYSGTATDVVIPSSYSIRNVTEGGKGLLVSTSALSGFDEYSYISFEFETLDGTIITKSEESLASLADEYTQLYIRKCNGVMSFDMVELMDKATYPVCCNGKEFNSAMDFEDYVMLSSVSDFDFTKGLVEYVEGNAYIVTTIDSQAFSSSSLNSVTIPSGITTIKSQAFSHCTSLTNLTISSSVTSIDNDSFYGCSFLASIVVEEGNSVYDSRDNCNAIIETATNTLIQGCVHTVIPDTVTSIGQEAFNYSNLTSITIPSSVTSIGNSAFIASQLTSITFKEGSQLTSIGDSAFLNSCLTNISIPNGTVNIGSSAFFNSNLTSVTIPSSVTFIGSSAFCNCNSLTEITILSTTPPTFANTNVISSSTTKIYIPAGTLEAYRTADNCSTFADKFVELEA